MSWKEKVKLLLLSMILYLEKPKDSTKKIRINESSKNAGKKSIYKIQLCSYIFQQII